MSCNCKQGFKFFNSEILESEDLATAKVIEDDFWVLGKDSNLITWDEEKGTFQSMPLEKLGIVSTKALVKNCIESVVSICEDELDNSFVIDKMVFLRMCKQFVLFRMYATQNGVVNDILDIVHREKGSEYFVEIEVGGFRI